MLYECNVASLNAMKYGPLVLSVVSALSVIIGLLLGQPETGLILNSIISVAGILIFYLIKDKLKYVAISKTQVIIKQKGLEKEYSWLDVESISFYYYFRIYRLKMKGEESIYFPPHDVVTLLPGDNSEMGDIIKKMKKELNL